MPIDTSMYANLQPVNIQSPLEAAAKALTMKHLALETQVQGQQVADNQAVRDAFKSGTQVGPDGQPTIDQKLVLSSLYKTAPQKAMEQEMAFRQQAQAALDMKRKQLVDNLDMGGRFSAMVSTDPKTAPDIKNSQYAEMRSQMIQSGYPNADKLPEQYPGDDWMNASKRHFMTQADQLKEQEWYKDFSIKDREASAKEGELKVAQGKLGLEKEDLSIKRDQFTQNKQNEAEKDLMGHAESSRQLPDVKLAYTDRLNAQKMLDLIGKGDPNKLDVRQQGLLIMEAAKLSTGGAPDQAAVENLTQRNADMIRARAKEFWTAHPEESEQGAFVHVLKEYAGTIQDRAQNVIDTNMGNLGEMYKDKVSASFHKKFTDKFINGNPNEYASIDRRNQKSKEQVGENTVKMPKDDNELNSMHTDDIYSLYKSLGGDKAASK